MPTALSGPLACVDLETTGGSPLHHRVIEVGIVLMDGGRVTGEWSSLVNPGCRIPSGIEQFTGISNDMVADAPAFDALADEVAGQLAGRLFVAHNARFDYGFLRQEFRRTGRPFRAPVLCTVKLSRRVDPEARRHNLDAVMDRHGIGCDARHRALGDARVLAELLLKLRATRDAANLDQLAAELSQEASLPPQLDPALADELPEGSGVYLFRGHDDALLYVGKSNNLRSRVLSHFATSQRSATELRLARQVQRVEWTETAGELGALLTEARWIKERAPVYNRRLRAATEWWTLVLAGDDDGLRVVPRRLDETDQDIASWHGLFRGARDAGRALDEMLRAHQLCRRALGLEAGDGSCFGFQVGRCRGACCGREPLPLHATRVRLALARHKLRDWPFTGRIAIREHDWRGLEELHVFDRWRHLGTVTRADAFEELPAAVDVDFDPDTYRILRRFLDRAPRQATVRALD